MILLGISFFLVEKVLQAEKEKIYNLKHSSLQIYQAKDEKKNKLGSYLPRFFKLNFKYRDKLKSIISDGIFQGPLITEVIGYSHYSK